MFWTVIWFIVNMIFVVSFIFFLFRHRAYSLAKMEGADTEKINRLHRRSKLAGLTSGVLFVAMAIVFLVNMKVNG